MKDNNATIDDFLAIAGVKKETVIRNANKIPGLEYKNGDFIILKGTRYPGDFHRYKLKNSAEKRYVLLKAISEYKYIDYLKLKVYQEQFVDFLKELLDAELIKENGLCNKYGANAYDCTVKGDKLLKQTQKDAVENITNIVSTAAGNFVGKVISEVSSGQNKSW